MEMADCLHLATISCLEPGAGPRRKIENFPAVARLLGLRRNLNMIRRRKYFRGNFRGLDRKEEKKKTGLLRLVRKKLQKLKGCE